MFFKHKILYLICLDARVVRWEGQIVFHVPLSLFFCMHSFHSKLRKHLNSSLVNCITYLRNLFVAKLVFFSHAIKLCTQQKYFFFLFFNSFYKLAFNIFELFFQEIFNIFKWQQNGNKRRFMYHFIQVSSNESTNQ